MCTGSGHWACTGSGLRLLRRNGDVAGGEAQEEEPWPASAAAGWQHGTGTGRREVRPRCCQGRACGCLVHSSRTIIVSVIYAWCLIAGVPPQHLKALECSAVPSPRPSPSPAPSPRPRPPFSRYSSSRRWPSLGQGSRGRHRRRTSVLTLIAALAGACVADVQEALRPFRRCTLAAEPAQRGRLAHGPSSEGRAGQESCRGRS